MVWLQFIVASTILVFTAMQLAKYSDVIAIRTRLGGMFVGTLLLAGATSLPELLTTINSLDQNVPNLAAGNLFGSNMFNMFMLAILDLTNQNARILRQVAMKHALTAGLAILLIGMGVFFIDINQDWKIGWVGLDSLLLIVVYLGGIRLLQGNNPPPPPSAADLDPKLPPLWKALLGFSIATAILVAVAPLLVSSSARIAEITAWVPALWVSCWLGWSPRYRKWPLLSPPLAWEPTTWPLATCLVPTSSTCSRWG